MNEFFDCVLFLTWSNWETEMRSNRFHYATRFAKSLPVIFVQVGKSPKQFYKLEDYNIFILNLEIIDVALINRHMSDLNFKCPLVWVYNPHFTSILNKIYSPIKIFHATEDYYSEDFNKNTEIQILVANVLNQIDVAVCVSEGVKENLIQHAPATIKTLVLTNGCDFDFWKPSLQSTRSNIVLYQGGITNKVDYRFLLQTVKKLKRWQFYFCGVANNKSIEWPEILNQPNVTYFKQVKPEKVRELALIAKVGIIPFVQNDWIMKRSFPLKAFEYLAAGLAVVSTPIEGLSKLTKSIDFANNVKDFVYKIDFYSEQANWTQNYEERLNEARNQDYTSKFERLESFILEFVNCSKNNLIEFRSRKNILVCFDPTTEKTNKNEETFKRFAVTSQHIIHFFDINSCDRNQMDLNNFDAIVLFDNSPMSTQLSGYYGRKILLGPDHTTEVHLKKHFDNMINCAIRDYSDRSLGVKPPISKTNVLVQSVHILAVIVSSVIAFTLLAAPKKTNFFRLQMQIYTRIKTRLRSLLN